MTNIRHAQPLDHGRLRWAILKLKLGCWDSDVFLQYFEDGVLLEWKGEVWSRFWNWNLANVDKRNCNIIIEAVTLVKKLNPWVLCAFGNVFFRKRSMGGNVCKKCFKFNLKWNTSKPIETVLRTAPPRPQYCCHLISSLGKPPCKKSAVFLTLFKRRGGGHSHVQNLCCKFCIIQRALWQPKLRHRKDV